MTREGLSMRKAREILRLRLGSNLSSRQVAKSCKVSSSTVLEYEQKARKAGLSRPLPEEMDDRALEEVLRSKLSNDPKRPMPDMAYLVKEMARPHVTLHLLWLEYREKHPEGYSYTQFCHYYNESRQRLNYTMRQRHVAGEKLFTDYAGDTAKMLDPGTGEIIPAYIFVATLGASNRTFAEGVQSLSLPSWIGSHARAFEVLRRRPKDHSPRQHQVRGHKAGPL